MIALRGPALDLLHTLPASDKQDYDKLTAALELQFGEQHFQQLFRTTRKQKVGETLQIFEAEVRRPMPIAYPTATFELQYKKCTAFTTREALEK